MKQFLFEIAAIAMLAVVTAALLVMALSAWTGGPS